MVAAGLRHYQWLMMVVATRTEALPVGDDETHAHHKTLVVAARAASLRH